MIYSTPEFLILLLVLLPLYFLSGYRGRFLLLLGGSLAFYAWAGFFDTAVFLFVVGFSWAAAALAVKFPKRKKPFIAFGIVVLAAHLMVWKYLPWLVRVAQGAGIPVHGGEPLFLPLPVGISFFTLQGIAYLIDLHKAEADYIPLTPYLLFKSFFPQLVAGPIVRVHQLLPQLEKLPTPAWSDVAEGVELFCLGFFKKIAIADRISPIVDDVFLRVATYDRASLIGALLGYAVQIWADFSGYSDMGIGVARMFGIRLPVNFLSPYFALSPSEFWKRWHITLSQWIRDYIYIPLGGSRGSLPRVLGVAVLTMALSGLWHGANWTFVVWGLYHGALLALERLTGWGAKRGKVLSWAFLMFAVLFGWLLFRAQSFEVVAQYLHGLAFGGGDTSAGLRTPLLFAVGSCMALQAWGYVDLSSGKQSVRDWILKRARGVLGGLLEGQLAPIALGVGMSVLVLFSLFLRNDSPVAAFIYFQF